MNQEFEKIQKISINHPTFFRELESIDEEEAKEILKRIEKLPLKQEDQSEDPMEEYSIKHEETERFKGKDDVQFCLFSLP